MKRAHAAAMEPVRLEAQVVAVLGMLGVVIGQVAGQL